MYRKVAPGEPGYTFIQSCKNRGMWVCDSYDHNEPTGCSNPECFKHPDREMSSIGGKDGEKER